MGSLQLDCPLCCNETFTCHRSLKYHLLSIIDNILCPVCSNRFDTIYELTKHLDEYCGVRSKNEESAPKFNIHIKLDNVNSSLDTLGNSILAKALLTPPKNGDNVLNKNCHDAVSQVEEEAETVNEEDISMTEDNGTEDIQNESVEEEEVEDICEEAEMYSCSSCGISFASIVDHIQEFHDGQEVVVEVADNDDDETQSLITLNTEGDILSELPEGATLLADENVLIKEFRETYEEEGDSNESQEISEVNKVRMPQILNTIKQEECMDKDGRLYTRKVVQIEKFWDDIPVKPRIPLILKYVVNEEGVLTKIKGNEEIINKAQIVEMYQCNNCGVQFSKREQYDGHSCEPEIGSEYKCSMCDTSFTNSQALCAHMKIHKLPKKQNIEDPPFAGPFICVVCETVFPTNKSLRLHRRMHEPVKAKEIEAPVDYGITGNDVASSKPREMFDCKVCNKSYDKSYEQMHMAYHSGVNHYDCYICNRKFYTHSNLEMHMRVHGNEKGHLCTHCKKGFISEESLQQHLKQHCSSRPYQCSFCTRRFARPHEKVKHERIHTGEKPHECEICGKTFRVSYCLTLHMRTHSGYRPYVCQHCGKRFKAHSVYNHHLLTHSDVRGYKCPYCPKAFKTGVQLAGHKNSHTKPFSCTQCNRPFASLYAVRAHMETHKRENNLKYNCYLCGASYARAFALRDHIKEQHVDAPQNGNSVALDIIEEGMEATTSILPDNDDISMVTLEEMTNVSDIEESNDQ